MSDYPLHAQAFALGRAEHLKDLPSLFHQIPIMKVNTTYKTDSDAAASGNPRPVAPEGGMEAQLIDLYAQRELLERELGISDAQTLIMMVRSMEAQLVALYEERDLSKTS